MTDEKADRLIQAIEALRRDVVELSGLTARQLHMAEEVIKLGVEQLELMRALAAAGTAAAEPHLVRVGRRSDQARREKP